jgi:hypothetical protein
LNSSAHPDDFLLVDRAGDILKAKQEGKIGLIGQIESCCVLNNNLSVLRVMYKLGVRVAGLTHGAAREYDLQAAKSPFDFCSPADREKARKKTSVPIRVRLKY